MVFQKWSGSCGVCDGVGVVVGVFGGVGVGVRCGVGFRLFPRRLEELGVTYLG